jgi:hypothetical protein
VAHSVDTASFDSLDSGAVCLFRQHHGSLSVADRSRRIRQISS